MFTPDTATNCQRRSKDMEAEFSVCIDNFIIYPFMCFSFRLFVFLFVFLVCPRVLLSNRHTVLLLQKKVAQCQVILRLASR